MKDETGADENEAADHGDTVSITEAARRLNCSVRTVQRRLDSGALESVEVDGQRRVKLPHDRATDNATPDATGRQDNATGGTPHNATTRHNDARQRDSENESQRDATRHDTRQMARHDATGSATRDTTSTTADGRVIEILERENAFLKSQIEAANRATSEAHAALRAALAAQPRALNEGSPQVLADGSDGATETGEFEPLNRAVTKATAAKQSARNSGSKSLTVWQRIAGRILGIR